MKKYAIYGAGAMGTVLGAYITKGGVDIDLISRNKAHIDELKANGAKITGKANFCVPVSAFLPDEMNSRYDVIFLLTKQQDNLKTAEFLKDYLTENGALCTLQNGLPELGLAEVLGEKRVYGCPVAWGATYKEPGVVELTSERLTFALGGLKPEEKKLHEIKWLLSLMGEVKTEDELIGARYTKLAVNSAFSALSCITGATFGEISKNSQSNFVALNILNECFSVAKAASIKPGKIQGVKIDGIISMGGKLKNAIAKAFLRIAMKKHYDLQSGMLRDLRGGKKCDIDYINGIIVSLGEKYGCNVKYNKKALEIIHGIEDGKYGISAENLFLFDFSEK